MDIEQWRAYKAETDTKKKNRILTKLLQDNEGFIAMNVRRLMRRGLVSPRISVAELQIEDLLQAARIAYITALNRFDPSKGAFPPFANMWIRHEVQQAAIGETTIRKPKESGLPYEALKKMASIRAQHGREATAEELGITDEELDQWRSEPVVSSYHVDPSHTSGGDGVRFTYEVGAQGLTSSQPWLSAEEKDLNPEDLTWLREIRGSVERLPDLQRKVIEGLYFTDKTVSKLLSELGIQCSTMYEVRDAALAELRKEV